MRNLGDSLKERLQAALAAAAPQSLEDAQRIANEIMRAGNHEGIREFHGVSPDEMQRLLSRPFASPELVELPAMLDTEPAAPVITLFKSLVEGIGEGIKATAKGNLPLKVVSAAAEAFSAHAPGDLRWRSSIRSEDDFPALNAVRLVSKFAGLIRVTRKQFALTQKCRKLLANGGMRRIYPILLQTYAAEFNWAYRDGYDEMPGIQSTFMFSLYLLMRYGDEYRACAFYEEAFLAAFPMTVREPQGMHYRSPAETVAHAYTVRTLDRFAGFFGLADIRRGSIGSATEVKATPLLADAVRFHGNLGDVRAPAASPRGKRADHARRSE